MWNGNFDLRTKLTIVVNSCDSYRDVWPVFLSALDEYWPARDLSIVINTESSPSDFHWKDVCFSYVAAEFPSKVCWGKRLISTLNQVSSEYVLLLFDDYILESNVDTARIIEAVEFLESNHQAAVFYINAVCVQTHVDDPKSKFRELKNFVDYRLNSAPGIWRKSELIKYTGANDDPWAWEVFGSYRTYFDNNKFYSVASISNNIIDYDFRKGGAIYRGKWVPEVMTDKLKKYGIDIDLNERGIVSELKVEKRSFLWKIKFMILGVRMVGVRAIFFVINNLRNKISAR